MSYEEEWEKLNDIKTFVKSKFNYSGEQISIDAQSLLLMKHMKEHK